MTGATPPASSPSATARPIAATRSGREEKARVPMARMHALARDIEHRRAVDRDSDFDEIMSDEASNQTRRSLGSGWLQTRLYRGRSRV